MKPKYNLDTGIIYGAQKDKSHNLFNNIISNYPYM